jgi:regulator of nucleoside diphosphate kinase
MEIQPMRTDALYVTEDDRQRLIAFIDEARWSGTHSAADLDRLRAEVEQRSTVPARDVPADVITLHTQVVLLDVGSGDSFACSLVLPHEADIAHYRISVLSPMGAAMLGRRVGEVFEWPAPAGVQRLKVAMLTFQPEAVGEFDL